MGGLADHQFINLGNLPNHWNDRDQIWRTYTDSSETGHRLNKLTPRAPMGIWRGSGGHKFKNVGKMPKSCTDRDQTWHTYTDSSGNGNWLKKITHRAPGDICRGFGVTNSKILERCQTDVPIVNKFGTSVQIRLHLNGHSWLKNCPSRPRGAIY